MPYLIHDGCPFCDRAMFEERIFAENDYFYAIASLGQITDGGYALIFPKRHARCVAELTNEEVVIFSLFFPDVKNAITAEYGIAPAIFEHGIAGQTISHAHIHLVPTKAELTEQVSNVFPDAVHESFEIITEGIPRRYPNKSLPYLLWCSSGKKIANIWWNPEDVPAQYFRIILARALGRPERANWRKMDAELDKRLWTETAERLKRYF